MASQDRTSEISFPAVAAALWLAAGWASASMTILTLLESADRSASFLSRVWWQGLVTFLGGEARLEGQSTLLGDIPFWPEAAVVAAVMAAGWSARAVLARVLSGRPLRDVVVAAG
ncbi:MAG: hypothetical protein AB7Q45_10440, partial [Planctomycetaceae bacterium]